MFLLIFSIICRPLTRPFQGTFHSFIVSSYTTIADPYPRPAIDSRNTNFHWFIQWSKLTALFVEVSFH